MAEFVGFLPKLGWFQHYVPRGPLLVELKSDLDARIELEISNWLVWPKRAWVFQSKLTPVRIVRECEASEDIGVFKVLKRIGQEDKSFAHGVGTRPAREWCLDRYFFDENSLVVDMHKCNLGLRVVASEHFFVVLYQPIRDGLAVERRTFVALCDDWDIAHTLLAYLDFRPILIIIALFDQERSQCL